MKVNEIKAKSIIVKSNLPDGDFVINPYVGCAHSCIYCYARFMKRFTGHKEEWGSFVDVKTNAPELVKGDAGKYKGRSIVIGSVCDPYQLVEEKYKTTRRILEKLVPLQPDLEILTKSDLVLRDTDLLRKFDKVKVAISLCLLDEKLRSKLEKAPSAERRINSLKKLHSSGFHTVFFISPILPELTEWKEMVLKTKGFVDEYWFENLNLYPSICGNISGFLEKNRPELVETYKEIYTKKSTYWADAEEKIGEFCRKTGVRHKIYFHHGK